MAELFGMLVGGIIILWFSLGMRKVHADTKRDDQIWRQIEAESKARLSKGEDFDISKFYTERYRELRS